MIQAFNGVAKEKLEVGWESGPLMRVGIAIPHHFPLPRLESANHGIPGFNLRIDSWQIWCILGLQTVGANDYDGFHCCITASVQSFGLHLIIY